MAHGVQAKSAVDQTIAALRNAQRVLFITGAGISAASGLPTYRGIGGLYNNRLTDDDIPIELALSGLMMQTRPDLTWTYIAQIEAACRGATFNRAHQIIAEMESYFEYVCVLTQNVDGFHHAAGSQNVIDIHGDINHLYCLYCDYTTTVTNYSNLDIPPNCPNCGGIIRPNVVLFGEFLPKHQASRLTHELEEGFDVVFSIGTTSTFPYIADPVTQAAKCGIPTIEINPGRTSVSDTVSIKFNEGAVETLSAIWLGLVE